MTSLRVCSKDFMLEFIEIYKNHPCLWQMKSKSYNDREKKTKAYEALLKKFKEVDPTANVDSIKKKINSLRTVYRKELSKVNRSIVAGAGEDDIYKPSLWYFEQFHFLRDQEIGLPKPSATSTNDSVEDEQTIVNENSMIEDEVSQRSLSPPPQVATTTFNNCSCLQTPPRKRKLPQQNDSSIEIMALVGKKLNTKDDDEFEIYGKHVANKLRNLDQMQYLLAQKLMNEIIFEAEMGTLNRNSTLINVGQNDFDFPACEQKWTISEDS